MSDHAKDEGSANAGHMRLIGPGREDLSDADAVDFHHAIEREEITSYLDIVRAKLGMGDISISRFEAEAALDALEAHLTRQANNIKSLYKQRRAEEGRVAQMEAEYDRAAADANEIASWPKKHVVDQYATLLAGYRYRVAERDEALARLEVMPFMGGASLINARAEAAEAEAAQLRAKAQAVVDSFNEESASWYYDGSTPASDFTRALVSLRAALRAKEDTDE